MMHENLDLSDINQVLHVVRNPYGWNEHVVRDARLKLADEFERLRAEVDALRADAERYRAMRREALITKRRGKWIVTWDEPYAQPTDSGIPFRENVDSAVDRLIAFHAECDSRYAARKGE
jgi:hypothetical protein